MMRNPLSGIGQSLGQLPGFIFGEGTQAPSYEALQKKREIIDALQQQAATAPLPQNHAEGVTNVARALFGRLGDARLSRKEDAERGRLNESMQSIIASLSGGGGPTMSSMGGGTPGFVPPGVGGAPASQPRADFQLPPGAGDFSQLFPQIEQEFRLPQGYLSRTAQIESGGNPNAANPNSSAKGLFQFIDSTAKQYGVNPMDPVSSTQGAARLAADNAAHLSRVLGREPSAAELYLAHQQGAGGAAKLLANPDARAVDIVGADAVRLNGGDASMSARDFAGLWLGKFEGGGGGSAGGYSGGGGSSGPNYEVIAQLGEMLQNPYLSPGQQAVAQAMIQQQMQGSGISPYQQQQLANDQARLDLDRQRFERDGTPKPTDDMREYEYAVEQGYEGTLQDFIIAQRRAGAPSVTTNLGDNQPADAPFLAELDKSEAKVFGDLLQQGPALRQTAGNLGILEQQLAEAPQGSAGAWTAFAGSLGLNVEGASEVQAAQATINAMVPEQRPPGTGPMSDADLALFKESLPRIINQPGGNQMILAKLQAVNAYQMEMSRIAEAVVSRQMTRDEARRAMSEVPNPLEGYRQEVERLAGGAAGAGGGQPQQIGSMAEFEALPSGTTFVAPDGSVRVKP